VDDLQLARGLAAGDEHAFHTLVDQQATRVFRICYRILGRVDEAQDAAQETFVAAYRGLATYRGDGPPAAWLARIATRECWRRAATGARRRAATTRLEDVELEASPETTDPFRHVVAAEQREQVRRAVTALPEPYREVIVLRFFADLPLADIGVALGRPEATIKTQLRRGLERLRATASGFGA
jgi:RNA polymerase sigma-70 factor (ECF subfamily)